MKTGGASSVFILFYTFICVGQAQNQGNSVNCGLLRFRCHNGECIESELLCDGKANCRDGSDEVSTECLKPEIVCSQYAFRCAYGACVDGDRTCDGVKDCVDNSDETLPRCGSSSNGTNPAVQCAADQVSCNSGQCIDANGLCDGHVDCLDGSDETLARCESFNCLQLVFRCNYGACIDGDKKCDGVRDCADGSDEAPELCAGVITRPLTVSPSYTTSTTTTTPAPIPGGQSCLVPPQPENGHWRPYQSQCGAQEDCELEQGAHLPPGHYLIYSCNPGYRIEGIVHSFCGPQGQWFNIPTCVEIHCKGLNSASTNAECMLNDEWKSCDVEVRPGTAARLSCRNSYRTEATVFSSRRDQVTCNQYGKWEPDPIRCIPECGLTPPHLVPQVVKGRRPSITEFPWHATLYKTETIGGPKEFICGATIIQENLLITAAHCIFDETTKTVQNPNKFFIATGNNFRDYDSRWHNPQTVRKAEVKNIYIDCNYLGFEGNFAWDIAILELVKPFVLTSILLPACLDIHALSDQATLESGVFGKVAGFGRTSVNVSSSGVLQAVDVPYVPFNECKSKSILHKTEKFITLDKFCAGYQNGTSVCNGDSGGGLVFKTDGLWYLRGVVSVSLAEVEVGPIQICDSDTYSLYTRVSNYIRWIQDVKLRLETSKQFPTCIRKRSIGF